MARPFGKIRFHHYALTALWPPLAFAFTGRPLRAVILSVLWPAAMAIPYVIGMAAGGPLGFVITYFVILSVPAMSFLNQHEGLESAARTRFGIAGFVFWALVLLATAALVVFLLSPQGRGLLRQLPLPEWAQAASLTILADTRT